MPHFGNTLDRIQQNNFDRADGHEIQDGIRRLPKATKTPVVGFEQNKAYLSVKRGKETQRLFISQNVAKELISTSGYFRSNSNPALKELDRTPHVLFGRKRIIYGIEGGPVGGAVEVTICRCYLITIRKGGMSSLLPISKRVAEELIAVGFSYGD